MTKFDPYEHLLRNFSKHKFKLFIEESIFNPKTYSEARDGGIPTEANKGKWEESDLAFIDTPRAGLMYLTTVSDRWLFHLDHVEDGLILPDKIRENARQDILRLVKSLAIDRNFIRELKDSLYDQMHNYKSFGFSRPPIYGSLLLYYLTNADFDPYLDLEKNVTFVDQMSAELGSALVSSGDRFHLSLRNAEFGVGIGTPKTFLRYKREETIRAIQRIESRPDSMLLQFFEGQIEVKSANKRKLLVYDKRDPKMVMIDQIINADSYFMENEIEEFEDLLNKPNVTETQLQRFFSAHPKFLLNVDYDELRPQVTLIDEPGSELRPDFFLKPIGKSLWDIMDIKLPNVSLVAGPNNRLGLSHFVNRGKAQLMNYSKFFDNPRNRRRVFEATGIDCFKPRLTLVIGKKQNVDEANWNRVIEQERPFVNIVGFDELLERAKKSMVRFPKSG